MEVCDEKLLDISNRQSNDSKEYKKTVEEKFGIKIKQKQNQP